MNTFTVQLFTLLLCTLTAFSQGFGFNPVSHMAPRPPQCWVDVRQFVDAGAADRTIVTNKLVDYSGHGWTWIESHANQTNTQYFTRFGGCLSTIGAASMNGSAANSNLYHVQMLSGPGSERQVDRGKHTNQCTLAIRMRYRTGNGAVIQTGTQAGPIKYGYAQLLTGTLYWDWGDGVNRISRALPSDFTDNWVNVFFTRGRTNQDVWMGGPTGPLTNFVSGLCTGLGGDGQAETGTFTIFGNAATTNWYVKRVLVWDYELPFADLVAWNQRMTELP